METISLQEEVLRLREQKLNFADIAARVGITMGEVIDLLQSSVHAKAAERRRAPKASTAKAAVQDPPRPNANRVEIERLELALKEAKAARAQAKRERDELAATIERLATLLLCKPHEVEHRAAHVLSLYVRASSAQQDAETELEASGGPVEPDEVIWSDWMTARAASLKLGIKSRETIWRYCATGRTASGRRVETRPVTDDDDVYPNTADLVRFEIRKEER